MKNIAKSVWLTVLLAWCHQVSALSVVNNEYGLQLSGPIERGDYLRIIQFFKQNPKKFVSIQNFNLNSTGGDVLEALEIAKFIRDTSRSVVVSGGSRCESACFLLLVAGGARFVSSDLVGIHRPYYDPNNFRKLNQSQAREAYDRLDRLVRQFLLDAKVSDDVAKKMFSTPSQEMRYFTPESFNADIGRMQPWYEELLRSACGVNEVVDQLRCMGFRSGVDRIGLTKKYLGEEAANSQLAWASEWRRDALTAIEYMLQKNRQPLTEEEKVSAAYPNWKATVKTSDFAEWLRRQSPDIRALAFSKNAEDAVRLLSLYSNRER